MPNLTITITNTLNIFGPSPSNKWNEFKWTSNSVGPGNGTWGMKSAGSYGTMALFFSIGRYVTWTKTNVITPGDGFFKQSNKLVVATALATSTLDLNLLTANGFYYVFPDRTVDAAETNESTYTSLSAGTITWTSAAAGSTSWS